MSKLESILFDSDEGPVSSLLRQAEGDENADTSMAFIPFTDRSFQSAPPLTQAQLSTSNDSPAVPASIDTMVFSSASPAMEHSPHSVVSDDKLSPQASMVTDKLREQLQKAQLDLIEERAMRKRKEKSLIKLAKELTARSVADSNKEKRMEEVTETIRDLECRLLERNRTIQSELPKLQQQCFQYETDVRAHIAKNEELRQQLNAMIQERKRLQTLSPKEFASRNATTQTGSSTLANNVVKDVPVYSAPIVDNTPLWSSDSNASRGTSVKKASRKVLSFSFIFQAAIVLGIASLVLVSVPNYRSNDNFSFMDSIMDGLCAPALPGTTWTVETSLITSHTESSMHTMIYEAPWWAPKSLKVWGFQLVCEPHRARTRLEMHKNSMAIFVEKEFRTRSVSKSDGSQHSSHLLWRGKVLDGNIVTVHPSSIAIHRRNYKWTKQALISMNQAVVDYIKAPWSSGKKA